MSKQITQIENLIREARFEEARSLCQALCRQEPHNARAWFDLGNINAQLGHLDEATDNYHCVLAILPRNAEACYSLARIAAIRQQADLAIQYYKKALEFRPDYTEAYNNLGNVFRACGLPDAAQEKGEYQGALENYRHALSLNPGYAEAHSNLLFLLSYNVLCSPQELLDESRRWSQVHGAKQQFSHHHIHGHTSQPLRIGYLSPDLRRHAVSYFLEPILAHHDRRQVEVFCYAEVKRPDEVTQRLQRLARHWRSTVGMSDEAVAQQIHDDRIHILIDLAGHTANNRLRVFTFKPAPIQATYLGYFATTGLDTMDYWITDEILHPHDSQELATESIFRLPRCCLAYQPPEQTPPVTQRAEGPVVFGSFNQLTKTSPQAIQLWADVLHAVPGSRMLIKSRQLADDTMRKTLLERFSGAGIGAERLTLMNHVPSLQEHLSIYGQVDIALDTIPRTGGSTTAEALWMGVPVITLAGGRFIERLSATMLHAVGLSGYIADTREAYIQMAVELAQDFPRRKNLRETLRASFRNSPLCDSRSLTLNMEAAFRKMWTTFLSGTGNRKNGR